MIIKCDEYNIVLDQFAISHTDQYVNFNNYSKVILLTEKKIFKLWYKNIQQYFPKNIEIIQVESGENIKNIKTATKIWQKMINLNADRKSLLINFGGGMISDLGGFIASTYMRGIDYVNIPTTLLSMVDASIGGKNAINLEKIKNIIGIFNNPKLVLIDINFLETLDKRELNSALAEIIKHGIIWDLKYFNIINNSINFDNKSKLIEIIQKSLAIKKCIVEQDFDEKNIRKLLNFGHTIGHSFETISLKTHYPLLHGEAVIIGMIIESAIAKKINMIDDKNHKQIINCILRCGFINLLKMHFNYDIDELISLIIKDKKNENGKVKLVLPKEIGKCEYNVEVNLDIIESCLREFIYERNKIIN